MVVRGTILARNEFKLFAVVSCIKGSFLLKTCFAGGAVEKRNYLITTIIRWNGHRNFSVEVGVGFLWQPCCFVVAAAAAAVVVVAAAAVVC